MNRFLDQQPSTLNFGAIKQRQQATWASGDYAVIGTKLQIVGEMLAEAADLRAGERVLDVAAGNGNATLAAARRDADVTSTDYVQALLDKGRERARAEGLTARFQTADAEHLPFADQSFDVSGQRALERDITTLLQGLNSAGDASLVVPSEYLEVVITKR